MLQNYEMCIKESILVTTILFQMLKRLGNKYDPTNFFLEKYDYINRFEDEKLDGTTSRTSVKEEFDMPPLEGDKEVKLQPKKTIAEKVKFIL